MTNTTSPTHAPLTAPLAQPKRPRKASALLLGTALGAIVGMGYGRGAYAQTTLSGSNTVTLNIDGPGEFVTDDTFSVDTSGDSNADGITITTEFEDGAETVFTDNNASPIIGGEDGIDAKTNNIGQGAIRITTSGVVIGDQKGILAESDEASLYISASRRVQGTNDDGIVASVERDDTSASLYIEVSEVYGDNYGIDARNYASGVLQIEATGHVEGEDEGGILAKSQKDTDVVIDVQSASGSRNGIYAKTRGSGNIIISASGDVTSYGVHFNYNKGRERWIAEYYNSWHRQISGRV